MNRIQVFATSAVIVTILGAFAYAREMKTDTNHAADFRRIHTHYRGEVKTTNPLYVELMQSEVDREVRQGHR